MLIKDMFKKFQKTSFYLIFSFFAFLLASSYSKSYAGIILTPYLGAAIANYDDSNNSSGTSNKLSDVRNNTKNGVSLGDKPKRSEWMRHRHVGF